MNCIFEEFDLRKKFGNSILDSHFSVPPPHICHQHIYQHSILAGDDTYHQQHSILAGDDTEIDNGIARRPRKQSVLLDA